MRLTEILQPECIKVPLASETKQDAIYELVDVLTNAVGMADQEELRQAVWKREQTRTTGIGHSIAVPHGKVAGCDHLCMALGKAAQPIEFGAIDGKPVALIFLLASPVDQTGPHIQALAHISHLLTDGEFRAEILGATTPQEMYEIISQQESKAPA